MPVGGFSYVQGHIGLRLNNQTVGRCLDVTAQRIPDREALVVHHENIRLTFAQLKEEVGSDFEPSKWAGAGPQVPSLVELQGWCLAMGQGTGAA